MNQPSKTKEYLSAILEQIRYKRAHDALSKELQAHISDQRQAYEAQGMDSQKAEIKAVEQMGDPVLVGTELDRIYRPKPQWSVITLTIALLLFGLIIRFFTSPQVLNGMEAYNKQLLFTVLGAGLMVLIYFIDFTILGKYPKSIFFSLTVLAILTVIFSPRFNGQIYYVTYILMLFPPAFAGIVFSMRGRGYAGILLCGGFFAIPSIIAFLTPSMSGVLILSVIGLATLTVAILKNWFGTNKFGFMLLVYVPALLVLTAGLIRAWSRLRYLFSAHLTDPSGIGYQASMVRQLLQGSQFIGQGALVDGQEASQILPGINTDFLLTYAIHRFGWISFAICAALLALFVGAACIKCIKQKSVLALLVSSSVVLNFTMQIILYISVNLGVILLAPLSLPLVSQGSLFLLVNMCLTGVLLSVFRTGGFICDDPGAVRSPKQSFISFEDGRVIIDFKPNRHIVVPGRDR